MKNFLKIILQYYLKFIVKIIIFIHRPFIIAIAGSTNKTFLKERISYVLRQAGQEVRSNKKSFNTEIGLPLAILNLSSGYNSYKNWLPIIRKAFKAIFSRSFPPYLVLELGVSHPRDMKYLRSLICPNIIIISDITQRYLESFGDMDNLVGEYEYLVKTAPADSLVLLNYDNVKTKNMGNLSKAKTIFFGLEKGADYQAEEVKREINGQKFTIKDGGEEIYLTRFGQHHIYAALAAFIIKEYVITKKN